MILVSACLLGEPTKYNGGSNPQALLMKYAAQGQFIAICPESLAKLAQPRPPAELKNGDGSAALLGIAQVVDNNGRELTAKFINGAQKALQLAKNYRIKYAILKERSPSCGVQEIYDGNFSHTTIKGMGVCAALLSKQGIVCISETMLTEEFLQKILDV